MIRFLHLPLKARWFRMIQSGEKREEYREITPYWVKRLVDICRGGNHYSVKTPVARFYADHIEQMKYEIVCEFAAFRNYTHVHFTLGYPRRDDASRHMVRKIKEITIGTGRPEWGAEPGKEYFVIKLED